MYGFFILFKNVNFFIQKAIQILYNRFILYIYKGVVYESNNFK